MNTPYASIVVPTYKEADNLRPLVEGVFGAMTSTPYSAEMIIVDDDSRDGSAELIEELSGKYPVRIIIRTNERGLSSAVIRGFREARGRFLVCMDADLSHPPVSVPELIRPVAEQGADFCIGSRYVPGGSTTEDWGWFRRLNSTVASLLARPLTRVRDPMAGFFCLTRDTLDRAAPLDPIGYKIGLELLVKAACRNVREVPIAFTDRVAGESKLNLREQWRYLVHLRRLYRYRWPVTTRLIPVLVLVALVAAVGRMTDLWG